jgi:hypothetical protein
MALPNGLIDGGADVAGLLKMVPAHLHRSPVRVAPHNPSVHAQLDNGALSAAGQRIESSTAEPSVS